MCSRSCSCWCVRRACSARRSSSECEDHVFYREGGKYKTTYNADQAIFPISQDRWFVTGVVLFAFLGVPLFAGQYFFTEVMIPVLILALAAIGDRKSTRLNSSHGYIS